MNFLEYIKAVFLGIVQGITEWLPVSSTGHMILFDEFFKLNVSPEFFELFLVVIQFGSMLAVVCLYFKRLWPFFPSYTKERRTETLLLWVKIIIGCVPAGIVGLLFDDFINDHFFNAWVVAGALIVYGIVLIVLEAFFRGKRSGAGKAEDISFLTAFKIGAFQILALIPGTSRSGSTIIGAMLTGVDRTAAAEFSFFLSVPIMAGASGLKILKYFIADDYVPVTSTEMWVLLIGTVTAFVVSLAAIKFLVGYVRRHSYSAFGWYRIALGAAVIICFALVK